MQLYVRGCRIGANAAAMRRPPVNRYLEKGLRRFGARDVA
jgi:hypothetical protein